MTTFANFLTREKFDAFVAACKAAVRPAADDKVGNDAWYQLIHDEREKTFIQPAMEFFKAKLATGELQPCPNNQGRSINFTYFWNTLVTGKGEEHIKRWGMEQIEEMFGNLMMSPDSGIFFIAYTEKQDSINYDEVYANLVKMLDTGNFKWHSINQYESCSKTAEFIRVQFEDWTPIMGTVTQSTFKRVEPITEEPGIQTAQFDFKTGNLVAMDWFRGIDGAFNNWLKSKGEGELPSINSDVGIYKTVEFYAKLGIVHVMVGNSSPSVFTGNGMIAVGNNWREYTADGRERYSDADDDGNESEEAEQEYEDAQENPPVGMIDEGSVCTDLWWVTMLERERLVEILIEQLGEEHRAEIEEYAASDFDVNLTVEPGKYTLHYDAHPSVFYPKLDDKQKFGIGTPYFALTKDTDENTAE